MNAYRTNRRRNMTAKPYPNAADTSYFLAKFSEGILCCASGVGVITILFFMLTM
mgnify:CR=1 FL=1